MCPLSQGSLSDLVLTNKPNVTFLNLEMHKLKFKKRKRSTKHLKIVALILRANGHIVKKKHKMCCSVRRAAVWKEQNVG